MEDILDKIRKPSLVILLSLLNGWLFFAIVFDDRPEIMYFLIILFFFFSFDYKTIHREYLYWLVSFIVIAIIEFNSHKMNVLTPIVLMHCVSTLNIKFYLKCSLMIQVVTALFLLIVVGNGNMTLGDGINLLRVRHDFGFGHPNVAANYYWGILISSLLLCDLSKYRKLIGWLFAILLLVCLYIYSETVSRSFIAIIVLFIFIYAYYRIRIKINSNYRMRYSKYVLFALPLVMTGLTIYFSLKASQYTILDILLSGRLSLYKELLLTVKPLNYLLGSDAFDRIVVDSSYLHLMFEIGILLFIYFIWLYYHAVANIIKQQNFLIIAVFISFMVYGLVESLLLLPMIISNNLFWVLLYKYRLGEVNQFVLDTEE